MTEFKYLWKTTHLKDTTKEKKSMPGSEQPGAILEKNKEIFQDWQLLKLLLLKTQVMDQCVLPTMTTDLWLSNMVTQ